MCNKASASLLGQEIKHAAENQYGEFKAIKVNQTLFSRKMFHPANNVDNQNPKEQPPSSPILIKESPHPEEDASAPDQMHNRHGENDHQLIDLELNQSD